MVQIQAGYRELEHTADWELEVWAPDLPGLLEQAARGMYSLSGIRHQPGPRHERTIEITASDPESLMVQFLSELLYFGENEGLVFDTFTLEIEGERLAARLEGMRFDVIEKEIKAVTYHNLNVDMGERGVEARVVFDV